jgi:plasmid stabilization system protein ParE
MAEFIILAGAEREILETYFQLEDFQEGLGARFSKCIDDTLELIGKHPSIGSTFRNPTRRRLVKGFPYAVFYEPTETRIIVHAVLDLRQSPEAILRRLGLD